MKITIGSDHRGFEAKKIIKSIITQMGHECIDVGTDDNNPVDYPDLAYAAAIAVSKKEADRAILACATGLGMCIVANKIKGIRAVLCHDELSAKVSRDHNDSNVLCLSGDQSGEAMLRKIVEAWLNTDFAGGRHQRRVNKIKAIEEGKDPREITNN
ncbi:MAG: ribose 5-phosphate isomerase B [Planctomycetes bacterium RBG_13_44_8b]|nr:MAG: ribose 5-phosphate isomerase B [Planctomycetes bacterium RBG_13_44_8b]